MAHSTFGGTTIARSLLQHFTPRQIVTDPVELITYETDASLMDRGSPDGVIFADTAADVARSLEWARQNGLPLIARGSGTGLSGGAVPDRGGVILSLTRMNRVLQLDEAGRSASVEPGVVNLAFDELVKTRGLYFPPDPASGRTATIGGNIAENAGGPHCFKYGVTTNYVTGLDLILADGSLVRTGGSAFDYPEYDFTGLINGSEGTLAVITRADLRLIRNPLAVRTALAAFDTVESAGAAVSAVIARGLVPATMEMMDQRFMRIIEEFCHPGYPCDAGALLIIEADGYPESVGPQIEEIAQVLQAYHPTELRIARDAAERERFWYGRKSAAGAKSRISPAYYLVDCTVPRSQLAQTLAQINEICDAEGLPVAYVFHAGDGNLHPSIFIPDPSDPRGFEKAYAAGRKVMELCVSKDGSITGEHGTGLEKRGYMPLMFTHAELQAMRDVKLAFDPGELLNPGKILPDEAEWPAAEPLPPVSGAATGDEPSFAPASVEEAASCVRDLLSRDRPCPVRVRGGGTKSTLLPPAGASLSTARLRGITAYAPEDLYVTAGAGTTLAELQAELARDGMMVPLVSPWEDATLGGIVSTGFNAPLRMRYGGIRDLVLSATVVLPDGRRIRTGRPVVKNVAGYDMTKLFVGAHGTLGLLADVTFKLSPLPRRRAPWSSRSRSWGWGCVGDSACWASARWHQHCCCCRGPPLPCRQRPSRWSTPQRGLARTSRPSWRRRRQCWHPFGLRWGSGGTTWWAATPGHNACGAGSRQRSTCVPAFPFVSWPA